MMTISIRTAVVTDIESLRGVFRRASLSNDCDRHHLLAHPASLMLSDDGVRQARTRVAVESDGEIMVGFASWLVDGEIIELEDLFVDPEWMRRGIGRALVIDVIAIARGQSFHRLEVTANPTLTSFTNVLDLPVITSWRPISTLANGCTLTSLEIQMPGRATRTLP